MTGARLCVQVRRGVLALSLLASPSFAATVLKLEEEVAKTDLSSGERRVVTLEETAWVGEGKARFDSGEQTTIVRSDLGKLWRVDHASRTYTEHRLPFRMEDELSEEDKKTAAAGAALLTAHVELEPTGQVRQIGPWRAREWKARIIYPMLALSHELDVWVSTDPRLDFGDFEELVSHAKGADCFLRAWYSKVLDLEGIVVASEERQSKARLETITTTRLVSIEERALPPDVFDVSGSYGLRKFELGRVFQLVGGERPATR